jgi:uncharacterized protein (DUF433 family)
VKPSSFILARGETEGCAEIDPQPVYAWKREELSGTADGCILSSNYLELDRMTSFDRITSNSAVLGGQPTIRGMRLTVRRVVEALALYPNWDDLRAEYPELEPEDIRQALEFAATNLDDQIIPLETV